MRHVAFLRAVNVGTHNRIKMEPLRNAMAAVGLREVSTYLQSGNVLFESSDRIEEIHAQLALGLSEVGLSVRAFVRSDIDLQRIVDSDPWTDPEVDDSHRFVTFLDRDDLEIMPAESPNRDAEIVCHLGFEVFSVARLNGPSYGNPIALIEKGRKLVSTTRNWAVVKAVSALLQV